MHSCLYSGTVQHCRFSPVEHRFRYRLQLVYLDLGELEQVARRYLSHSRRGAFVFRRDRHLGQPEQSLDTSVRQLVRAETGLELNGPIRLLTMLDHFGYYFSPLNLYYCLDGGENLQAIVAEVNNIPWREQHVYLLWAGNGSGADAYEHPKAFHVSPFMEMGLRYRWQAPAPTERLTVGLQAWQGPQHLFTASMSLERQPLSRPALRRSLWQFPWMSGQVVAAIYYQAFRLWRKQCPVFTHPQAAASSPRPRRGILPPRFPEPARPPAGHS